MTRSESFPAPRVWEGWGVFLLALAALLPTLGAFRLLDADELTHARVALEAWRMGHWLPLTLAGQPWSEKPPLLLWATAWNFKLFGTGETAVRLWPCLGAALTLALAWNHLRARGLLLWQAALCVAALGLSQDFLYHARFLSMDTCMLACGLGSLEALAQDRPWKAGAWLALAAWVKSWFVLAWLLPWALALWTQKSARKRGSSLAALILPPILALLAWLGLYAWAYGSGFGAQEWSQNLLGRLDGHGYPVAGAPALFYLGWARLFFPVGLVSGLAALGRMFAGRSLGENLRERALSALLLTWGLGLLCVRTTVYHYFLPWGFAGVLLWFPALLSLDVWASAAWLPALLGLVWAGPQTSVPHVWMLPVLALAMMAGWRSVCARTTRASGAWALGLSLLLVLPAGLNYLLHPPDPNGPLIAALRQNPPQGPLRLLGRPTQAPAYYGLGTAQAYPTVEDLPPGPYWVEASGEQATK